MDEHIVLNRGRTITFLEGGDLVDHNLNDIDAWIAKHNRYATLAMVDYLNREVGLFDEIRESAPPKAPPSATDFSRTQSTLGCRSIFARS